MGTKFDEGKLDWTLIPWVQFEEVVKVFEFGAKRYGRDNWKSLDNFNQRYLAAAFRHFAKVLTGEKIDPDSGLNHKAHIVANLLFLLWKDDELS